MYGRCENTHSPELVSSLHVLINIIYTKHTLCSKYLHAGLAMLTVTLTSVSSDDELKKKDRNK